MAGPLPVALLDGIGFSEILMIGFVAILVYGGRLPEVMRSFGQAYGRFRRGLSEASQPLREEIQRATTLPAEAAAPITTTPSYEQAAGHDGHEVPSVPYGAGNVTAGGPPAPGEPSAAGPFPSSSAVTTAPTPTPTPTPTPAPAPWPAPPATGGEEPPPV